jgi:hypothetical protein
MNQEEIISTFKHYIKNDMLDRFEDYFYEITSEEYHNKISYPYIFQKIYLFSCIKGKRELLIFLFQVYKTFALTDRIALRPTIIYGKYLYKGADYPNILPQDPKDF